MWRDVFNWRGSLWRNVKPQALSRLVGVALAVSMFGAAAGAADSLDDRLASADPGKGAAFFDGCRGCHSVEEGGPTLLGPNLWGVIERPVASVDGYAYSDALKDLGGKWELGRLDAFLADPANTAPGTTMAIGGVKNGLDRANLIAYLNQNSPNPLPIGVAPGSSLPADLQSQAKKDFRLLVDAPGVEKTHAYCTPCHSEMIIVQQGKTRKRWEDNFEWMIKEQGMADIAEPDRSIILDYLEANYNEDRPNFPQR